MSDPLTNPVWGSETLPMPSSEECTEFVIGAQMETPLGGLRTQELFRGDRIKMSWAGLSKAEFDALRQIIDGYGYTVQELTLSDGAWYQVVVDGLEAFEWSKRYNPVSQAFRYEASLSFREVP